MIGDMGLSGRHACRLVGFPAIPGAIRQSWMS